MPGNPRDTLSTALRDRSAAAMAVFSEALDATLANPTPERLERLRLAADELMRSTGRVLIEIERLRD